MSQETRKGELEFSSARALIEKELEEFLSASGIAELPHIGLEKDEFRFSFQPPVMSDHLLLSAIALIMAHIEHVRIHTFEPGYMVFQALGDNPYQINQGSFKEIKFKFVVVGSSVKVEISRKGNITENEALLAVKIFQLFHPEKKQQNPESILRTLGVDVFRPEDGNHTWATIAGYESTKDEVRESIVLPLQHPEMFRNVARMARGKETDNIPGAILFQGPPGVGKTSMARIIATETGIPMIYVPVENILSKYYGESAQNMAAIFDAASLYERAIIFLDEIDSLAGSRDSGMYEATRRVLSVLLRKIDGFERRQGILTIGATNRSEDLDRALLSRFDHIIEFPLPDPDERKAIFAYYAQHLDDGELSNLADISDGLSGRHIEDVCEYAERRRARELIRTGEEASPPPMELYAEVTRLRTEGEEKRELLRQSL